jgi:prepilin-type N-terminal cleavage/methylation domain-containing protein
MKTEHGYSLVELLSVTVVLGIVVAIAVPNLLRARRSYEVQASAQQIAQLLEAAKIDAVGKSTNRKLVFDAAQNTLTTSAGTVLALPATVSFAALPGHIAAPPVVQSAAQNARALPGQQGNAASAVSLPAGAATGTHELSFNGRGLPAVEPGVLHWLYLTNQDGQRVVVTLTSSGSTAIQTWRDGVWK